MNTQTTIERAGACRAAAAYKAAIKLKKITWLGQADGPWLIASLDLVVSYGETNDILFIRAGSQAILEEFLRDMRKELESETPTSDGRRLWERFRRVEAELLAASGGDPSCVDDLR